MQAIRFHYRPVRYLLTRGLASRWPGVALSAIGCVRSDEVEPPTLPGPEWVRVETTLSGVCGSDLAALTAHDSFTLEPFGAYPFTFGHENVGRIVEAGAGAVWREGEAVIVNPMLGCEQRGIEPGCAPCSRGEYGLCRNTTGGPLGGGPMIGYCPRTGGGWSRWFVAHRSQLHSAGSLEPETAVLADPLASALRPVLLQPPVAGDQVLVIGGGTIGALTVRALRATGWDGEVAVLARYGFQAELAERAGATRVLRGRDEVFAWAAALPGARRYDPTLADGFVEGGPSLIFDTVGSQATARDSLALAREGGRIVMVGSAARVKADWTRLWYRQLTVAGIFAYGMAPWQGERREIYEIAIALLRGGGFGELGMVTHIYALEDYRAALGAALDKGGHRSIKVAFRPAEA
ncbi:MAG: alcohol dehydrogenase catalytic domain-containing protein [Gemmatimonadetes bacterium]|nr:alcohol dehydrogenase catalytic domain-containing protein [Gemmatimonadota bacterium]